MIYNIMSHGSLRLESEDRLDGFMRKGTETIPEILGILELVRLEDGWTDVMKECFNKFWEFPRRRVEGIMRECRRSKKESERSRLERPCRRQVVQIAKKTWGEGRGKWKGQSQKRANKQMMSDKAGRFGLGRAENSTIEQANGFIGRGIRSKATWSSGSTKTERDITILCRLRGESSSRHLVFHHTIGVLDRNMLSRDGGDLSELSSVRFHDARALNGIGEGCFFRTSLKSEAIPESAWKIGGLSFGFCEHLDHLDAARESQLQRIERGAFLSCSLKLIRIPRSVTILETFAFSKSGVEIIAFESESALKRIDGFCFCESSLKTICIPSHVDCIGKCPAATNILHLIDVCEANARFTMSEHTLIDRQDAMAVRYFGGGERVVANKYVRRIDHMCFGQIKFGSSNFAPDSELALLERRRFELCSVQSIIIPSSVRVIGTSNFRKANIETLRFERGSRLHRLESGCFAWCSLGTIVLPARLEALPSSRFMGATIKELTFEDESVLR
jgi:hypothetical protein